MPKSKKATKSKSLTKSVKSIVVTSAIEYLSKMDLNNFYIYRGQSQDWSLIPSIARCDLKKLGYHTWNVFQDQTMTKFKKRSLPFLNQKPTNDVDWLILAQHHGYRSFDGSDGCRNTDCSMPIPILIQCDRGINGRYRIRFSILYAC
jgi:hypothetical protein